MSTTPTRITHLIGGTSWQGSPARTSPVFNPATGEQIHIKASKKVAFRAAKELKEAI